MPSKIYADTFGNSNETDAITIDASGNTTLSGTANNIGAVTAGTIDGVTIGGTTPTSATFTNINGGQLAGMRNLIINGDMRIDQRNGGASVTVNNNAVFWSVDRFYGVGVASAGTFTMQQSADAPSGFDYSLLCTSGTTASSGAYRLHYNIEGNDIAKIGFGKSWAKNFVLSFRVKTSQVGTYTGSFRNDNQNRSYVFEYTTTTTDWESHSISLTADSDTGATWAVDNTAGLKIIFQLADSGISGTSGSWVTGNYFGSSNQTNAFIANTGSTFQITGVQLEVGSTATAFEHRPYGVELASCQRYLQKISQTEGSYSINFLGVLDSVYYNINHWFTVPMRSAPSLVSTVSLSGLSAGYGTGQVYVYNLNANASATWTAGTGAYSIAKATTEKTTIRFGGTSLTGTSGDNIAFDNILTGYDVYLSAEL